MNSLTAQFVGVALALVLAVGWIVKRILRRGRGAADSCHGCPVADSCHTRNCSGCRQKNDKNSPCTDGK